MLNALFATKRRKVVAGVVAWLCIAAIAFAAFLRQGSGTVTVTTTSPDDQAITLFMPVNFSQSGQERPLVLQVDANSADAGAGESYSKYHLTSVAANSGPCAGLIGAGFAGPPSGSLFRNTTTGAIAPLNVVTSGGTPRRTEAAGDASGDGPLTVTLDPSAGPSCQNQSDIPLEVVLELIP